VLLGAMVGAVGLPVAADWVLGSVHVWQTRYMLFLLPVVAMAAGIMWGSGRWGRVAAGAMVAVAAMGNVESPRTETDWPSVARSVEEMRRSSGGGDVVFVVERADDAARRIDVETDVRLLGLMLGAHARLEGAKAVLLDEPDAAAVGGLSGEVVMVTAWRQGEMAAYLPGFAVREVRVWPGMGVRLVAARRTGVGG